MRLRQDKTKGGHQILCLDGPYDDGSYAGIVLSSSGGGLRALRWGADGRQIGPGATKENEVQNTLGATAPKTECISSDPPPHREYLEEGVTSGSREGLKARVDAIEARQAGLSERADDLELRLSEEMRRSDREFSDILGIFVRLEKRLEQLEEGKAASLEGANQGGEERRSRKGRMVTKDQLEEAFADAFCFDRLEVDYRPAMELFEAVARRLGL